MDFLEKAQARANALVTLGLVGHPDMTEVKAAFKSLAFERHPDRGKCTDEESAEINAAYMFLKEDNGFTVASQNKTMNPVQCTTPPRPMPKRPDRVNIADILRNQE